MTKKTLYYILAGIALFAFRIMMGLSKFSSDDEFQIYLIGLKSYTTGLFPYFGPDVVYTETQLLGALQGLLISIPLYLFQVPEAPYIILNILTFCSLIFFGWYLSRRFPSIPIWFTYIFLFTCPWTMQYTTHIINPSYVLVGGILFFVSIIELGRFYTDIILNKNLLFFSLGFSLFWTIQLHMSWVLMGPYLVWVFWLERNSIRSFLQGLGFFTIGSITSALTLIPTFLAGHITGGLESTIVFNAKNLLLFPSVVARFFSFGSYEILKFIGHDNGSRLNFLSDHIWVAPFIILLFSVGIIQVIYFLISFFRSNDSPQWIRVRWFIGITLLLLCTSFLFSITKPGSHKFYLLFPIAIWYSFHCYEGVFTKNIRILASLVIASGVLFQCALFMRDYDDRSLFASRQQTITAMQKKDYTLLGIRRESRLMKSNKTIPWKQTNRKGSLVWFSDFEPIHQYFWPQNIVGTHSVSGSYSCKIDSIQPYSRSFSKKIDQLNFPTKVSVSCWLKPSYPEDYRLIIKIQDEIIVSHGLLEKTQNNRWTKYSDEFELPKNLPPDSKITIYFQAPNKIQSRLYIDDLSFTFKN